MMNDNFDILVSYFFVYSFCPKQYCIYCSLEVVQKQVVRKCPNIINHFFGSEQFSSQPCKSADPSGAVGMPESYCFLLKIFLLKR